MDTANGLSINELNFRIDYLTMQLEQIENVLMRKKWDMITTYRLLCQIKLDDSEARLHEVNRLLNRAAKGTEHHKTQRLEDVFFQQAGKQSGAAHVAQSPNHTVKKRLLG